MSVLAAAFAVPFAIIIVALLAQSVCAYWSRRRFRQQALSTAAHASVDGDPKSAAEEVYYSPSKELLYFFFWTNQPQAEPQVTPRPENQPEPTAPVDIELDVLKLYGALYGNPKFLFTVREEEREIESKPDNNINNNDNHNISSRDSSIRSTVKTSSLTSEEDIIGRVSFSDCFGAGEDDSVVPDVGVTVLTESEEEEDDDDEDEEEPERREEEVEDEEFGNRFSTPCASPPYLTPTPSPPRDSQMDNTNRESLYSFAASERGRLQRTSW